MKTISVIFVALNFLALATAGSIFIPDNELLDFECPDVGGVFAHETACEKYYICSNGDAKEYTCDDKMLFDLVYMGCNFAYLTYCGDRIRPPGYASTISPEVTTRDPGVTPDPEYKCPSPGGAFPHPIYCELYYVCIEDVPTLHICPEDQLFDLLYDGCNFSNQVDCGDRIPPNGTVTGPTQRPPVTGGEDFDCPSAGGAFPHEQKCELYYLCVEDVASLEVCPAGQLFDLVFSGCNFEELVDCGDREHPGSSGTNKPTEPTKPTEPEPTGPTKPPVTGPTVAPGEECPEATGLFPDPLDCSAFYNCDNFIGIHTYCPAGLYFSIEVSNCDFAANVDCGDRPEPTTE